MKKKILLVEPNFPIPPKSKNHKNFLPVGLLKIASYLQNKGIQVKLVRGVPNNPLEIASIKLFKPNEVWITSIFTYWANYVKEAVKYYKDFFPKSKVIVGGIYASLLPSSQVKEFTGCDEVYKGVFSKAEKYLPDYSLIENHNSQPIDYQIIHISRGCKRRCSFCGSWKIEPEFTAKKSIKDEIKFKKIIFYDNNLLMNEYIEDILQELIELKMKKKILWCESQSGFDGRVLLKKPYLASMLKKAGFRYPRIAWDGKYNAYKNIEKQIQILKTGGYKPKDIYVFVLYNWEIPFEEMERKRLKCFEWQVQIADCRFRPLNQLFDNFNPRIDGQSSSDYYIHPKWSDSLIKQFRRNVREQNICVRHEFPYYSRSFERKKVAREIMRKVKNLQNDKDKIAFLKSKNIDFWFPNQIRYPSKL